MKRNHDGSYVFVGHVFEHSEFPVGPFGVNGGLERPGQLLDGHSHGTRAVGQQVLAVGGTANLQ